MAHRPVVVFTVAAIPLGHEVGVEVFDSPAGSFVRVQDLVTSIFYGGVKAAAPQGTVGHVSDWTSLDAPKFSTPREAFRGRVISCVVSNVAQQDGYAVATSLVVDTAASPPYR